MCNFLNRCKLHQLSISLRTYETNDHITAAKNVSFTTTCSQKYKQITGIKVSTVYQIPSLRHPFLFFSPKLLLYEVLSQGWLRRASHERTVKSYFYK